MVVLRAILFLVCVAVALQLPDGVPAERGAPQTRPAVNAEQVRALVRQLGAGDFDQRRDATRALRALGSDAFDILTEEYRASDDYEVRLRIQEVVEVVFFEEQLFGRMGFLGVSFLPAVHAVDDRVPRGQVGIDIHNVVPGTAADLGGLRAGDLIVGLNGQPLSGDLSRDGFSDLIRDAGPGTVLRFEVYRGREPLTFEVTLGRRPIDYYADPVYERALDDTSRHFRRWWREHVGDPARPRAATVPMPATTSGGREPESSPPGDPPAPN